MPKRLDVSMLVLGLVLLSIGTTIRGSRNVILVVDKVEVHYTNVDFHHNPIQSSNSSSSSSKMTSISSAANVDAAQPREYRLRRNTTITNPATNHTNPKNRTLYLHIGPLKTGTTTIQDIMRHTKIQEAAEADGIALLSTFEQPIEDCFTKLREDQCATKNRPGSCLARTQKMYKTCPTLLRDYFDAQQDASTVFLSHEVLGSTAMKGKYWGMLMSVLGLHFGRHVQSQIDQHFDVIVSVVDRN